MDTYAVKPVFSGRFRQIPLSVRVPGSKSITNRALMIAALADGTTLLRGAQFSSDAQHFMQCLKDLGFSVEDDRRAQTVLVRGEAGRIPKEEASINVSSAGTAARFLTAMLAFSQGTWHLDSSEQMRHRPMAALLDALTGLGCGITPEGEPGHFPFTIHGGRITASGVTVNIDQSSQFLSALLMAGVLTDHDFDVHAAGTHGLAYTSMTMAMMQAFGADVTNTGRTYHIPGSAAYKCREEYEIEPDVSAAAYFYGLAAISGESVTVQGVHPDSLQGDIRFLDVLVQMGCSMKDTPEGIRLTGPAGGRLHGIDIDMHAFSDQALTLAAIAPYADAPVTIRGIGHIRGQECDRMAAITQELGRMGIRTQAGSDEITIWPGQPQPALVQTYHDHRVAMAFALTGLRSPGIVIGDPDCCRKTFADYFAVLDGVCRQITGDAGT